MADKIIKLFAIDLVLALILLPFSLDGSQNQVRADNSPIFIDQDTVLGSDITGSVKITNDNITLDCQGHSIVGSGSGSGIFLKERKGAVVKNCKISNFSQGIYLESSSNNQLIGNEVFENETGISLWCSSDNLVIENNISNNDYGIYLMCVFLSSNNLIYHNNFINNKDQAVNEELDINFFDKDYPEGGNYWSDYTGKDEKSGPNQDQPGSDGIGDTPYIIYSWYNPSYDKYPFIKQNGWKEPPPPASPQKWSFAIITDLHIGRGYSDYAETGYDDSGDGQDYYLTERLEKTVNWLIDNKNNIDCGETKCPIKFLAVLGDFADSAEKSEFLKAKEILDKLNDPNRDGDFSDGIPYVVVFGNHDIWPHTDFEEAKSSLGEIYFDAVFWDENATNTKLMKERMNFQRNGENPKCKNFAFSYEGMNFIGLDFIKREGITKGSGDIISETENWLKGKLNEYQGEKPVILFTHHPLVKPFSRDGYVTRIWNFDSAEIKKIKKIIGEYENLVEGTQILGNFSGHIHGFDKLFKEIPKLGKFSPFDLFFDANFEYPAINVTPVLTTESLMVAGNEKDISNKGVIRIVKAQSVENIDYSTIEGKFPALNPYISFDFKIAPEQIYPCVFFKAHLFTHRDYSLLWNFADGKIGSGEINTHCYENAGTYNVRLTGIDKETGEQEYITREIKVKQGIIPKIIKIAEELKEKLELISIELGENLTEFGRTMKDAILVKVKHSPSTPVGLFIAHFEQVEEDIDLTGLTADFDLVQRKSILYAANWPKEIEEEKILFIPSTGVGSVYICPHATTLKEVNPECEDKTILNVGETKNGMILTLTEYENKEYYLVYGITGTGGEEMSEEDAKLETQIAITEMNYGEEDILNKVKTNLGIGEDEFLLLSDLKENTIDLEDGISQLSFGQTKKLKMKFKFLETAGNEYQRKNINVKFNFLATQEEQ